MKTKIVFSCLLLIIFSSRIYAKANATIAAQPAIRNTTLTIAAAKLASVYTSGNFSVTLNYN